MELLKEFSRMALIVTVMMICSVVLSGDGMEVIRIKDGVYVVYRVVRDNSTEEPLVLVGARRLGKALGEIKGSFLDGFK